MQVFIRSRVGVGRRESSRTEASRRHRVDEAEVAAGEGVREPEVSLVDGVIFEIPASQFLEDVGLGADDLVHHGAQSAWEPVHPRVMDPEGHSGLGVGVVAGVADWARHA